MVTLHKQFERNSEIIDFKYTKYEYVYNPLNANAPVTGTTIYFFF